MYRSHRTYCPGTFLMVSGLFALVFVTTENVEADEIAVGRYRTLIMQPVTDPLDVLSAEVDLEFPEHVSTVGEAMDLLLDGSGYQLLGADFASPDRAQLLALPLPDEHRRLGPISLRQALERLSGPAYRLLVDPEYRLVSFPRTDDDATSDDHVECQE